MSPILRLHETVKQLEARRPFLVHDLADVIDVSSQLDAVLCGVADIRQRLKLQKAHVQLQDAQKVMIDGRDDTAAAMLAVAAFWLDQCTPA